MKINFKNNDNFLQRHIGPREEEVASMLKVIGAGSLHELINETVPDGIRTGRMTGLDEALSEHAYKNLLRRKAAANKVFRSFIGMGYYGTVTPAVIQRNIFENPGWYTQYTPYQAEIAQGRLEALINFQTMVSDLTGLPIANASLLDEGTAAAEAMIMFFHQKNKRKVLSAKYFVSDTCYPQTIDVLRTKATPLGIELVIGDYGSFTWDDSFFGALLQYPDGNGAVNDYRAFIEEAHANNCYITLAADILALAVLTSPGELGADAAVGNTQRFGVPMGYGGPHAAYFATREDFKRFIPGRIIGVSIDEHNNSAYRMALQTREQHIRREKATSNICTAQALLAIMAGMYTVYHGKEGIINIAEKVHSLACMLNRSLTSLGYVQLNNTFFDTLKIEADPETANSVRTLAEKEHINFRYFKDGSIGIALDETTSLEDVFTITAIFGELKGKRNGSLNRDASNLEIAIPGSLIRTSDFLQNTVFNRYRSETEMMRYIKRLENKDLSLTRSMIPLGSCTMKLNAASELMPVSWPEFSSVHPFVPLDQVTGYLEIINELSDLLCKITGFTACSLQPNSGAQGEYAGLMVIRARHIDDGNPHRNVVLIPSSAHGTNPASAVMAGMEVVVVKCDHHGNIDVDDLRSKAEANSDKLSALMVTYPSTHGVFEARIREICDMMHQHGAYVYMDGANMNAQVGLTNPAAIGADVCHLNLHKTFAIPHGGGGPGMGPICVNDALKPYLPGHPVVTTGGEKAIHAINSAPFGSASILLISYAYIKMLGFEGCTAATEFAILNANYLKSRLEHYFPILYQGDKKRVAHEFILDFRPFKNELHIEVEDVAKRLMDYGFHAPTVSFPVAGTMMVEPTESESLEELDRFCDAMIQIRLEIAEIEHGFADIANNVLKNAPHTMEDALANKWDRPYSREKAVFPLPYVRENKFWPSVARINNSYGDRNLICTCPSVEEYAEMELAN